MCGVIFAKVEQARADERNALSRESAINRKIEKVLRNDPVDERFFFQEKEVIRDRESYPFIEFLINFFLFAAALVGIGCIMGAIHFWNFLTQLPFFSTQYRIFLILAITFTNAISVGLLLAIPAALTLGRDIANNTRASRECLFRSIRLGQE
ncbi:MAG: hypothetical protein R2940_07355 [Syntrophotaleaceae bacterium]